MPATPTVVVDGLKELRRDLRAIDKGLGRQLTRDIKTVVEQELLPTARQEAPKRTGRLAASIRVSVQGRGATIGSRLPYAAPIHWGWARRGIKPNQFLVRAAQRDAEPVAEGIAKAVDGFLRRHGFD